MASSSSAPKRKKTTVSRNLPLDRQRHVSIEAQNLWPIFSERKVQPGRHVDVDDFAEYHVRDRFAALGWLPILLNSSPCYTNLVRQFYGNLVAHDIDGDFRITSLVKGVHISFTMAELANIWRISNEGDHVFCEPREPASVIVDPVSQQRIYDLICPNRDPRQKKLPEKLLIPDVRVFSRLIQLNILPTGGHREGVGPLQAYLAYCLHIGHQVSLPYVVMRRMVYVRYKYKLSGNLPFGKPLTLVFTHFGVDMTGERKSFQNATSFNRATMKKMQLAEARREGGSGRRERGSDDDEEEGHDVHPTTGVEGASSSQWSTSRFLTDFRNTVMDKLGSMNTNLVNIHGELGNIHQEMKNMNLRMNNMNSHLGSLDKRVGTIEEQFKKWSEQSDEDSDGGEDQQ